MNNAIRYNDVLELCLLLIFSDFTTREFFIFRNFEYTYFKYNEKKMMINDLRCYYNNGFIKNSKDFSNFICIILYNRKIIDSEYTLEFLANLASFTNQ